MENRWEQKELWQQVAGQTEVFDQFNKQHFLTYVQGQIILSTVHFMMVKEATYF